MSEFSPAQALPPVVVDPARLSALESLNILDTPAESGFDDIVHLAVLLCEVPVGLVSLVAGDRQWFKARIGFSPTETDLSSSVCAHALIEPDLLVITDLTVDPRTRFNPLVTGEPYIRFYAGAPLRAGDQVLGSLCVIDSQPRPGGLTAKQAEGLRALGRQVSSQLELRRLLNDRDVMVQRQQRIQDLLRTVTDNVGQAVFHMDSMGAVLFANPAAANMFGYSEQEMLGQSLHELLHHSHPDGSPYPAEDCDLKQALTAGELLEDAPQVFFRKDGAPRQVLVTNAPVFAQGRVQSGVLTVVDVTDRLRIEQAWAVSNQRKAALAQLADHLRTTLSVDAMSYTAAAIIGPVLGAVQTAYATVEAGQRTVQVSLGWSAPGAPNIAGLYTIEDYGSYLDELKAGRTVIVTDVHEDPRTRDQAAAFGTLATASFINVPVVEHGDLVALFAVHFAKPRQFSREEEEFIRAAVDRTRTGIARVRAEGQQGILNNELSHRLKNSMAMIQAIANQTLKGVADREPVEAFENRLMALSTAHDVLLQKDWEAADLEEVLRRVLDAAGAADRYAAIGPTVTLGPRAALSTSLLLHELATNASKYGALTVPAGRIEIGWALTGGEKGEELVLTWREIGGPPAAAPKRQGFGSKLLRLGLIGTGGSQVDYQPSGITAIFRAPRKQVNQA